MVPGFYLKYAVFEFEVSGQVKSAMELDLELTYNMLGSGEDLLGGPPQRKIAVLNYDKGTRYRHVDERRRAHSSQLAWSYSKQF